MSLAAQTHIQGGPAKVKPTYIIPGNIGMHRPNLMIFGYLAHTISSGVMQISSKFCLNKHLTR